MKQRKIALGPGASSLILIIVVLSMCVLCMLTFISARNDESLSLRSARMIENVYMLQAEGERSFAALDAVLTACAAQADNQEEYMALVAEHLPQGMTLEQDTVTWTESAQGKRLDCAVYLAPLGEYPRAVWTLHALGAEEEDVEELWN